MIRNRLGTLLIATVIFGACGEDEERRRETDGGVTSLDGSMDAQTGMDGKVVLPDGAIVEVAPDGAIIERAMDGAILERQPDGAIVNPYPIPDGGPFVVNDAGQVLCGSVVCQCSDGVDQDGDSKIDVDDPECIAPWDNDESSFGTGLPGDNRDPYCQDCFFDGNSGSGDDGCRVATSCLTNKNDPSSGNGNCKTCQATDQCRKSCQAYTPNGCDCFGCCTVHLGSGITKNVALGAGCNIDGSDTSGCMECQKSTSCENTCRECELCPGKTLADLPASCFTSTTDGGVTDGSVGTPDGGVPGSDGGVPGSDSGTIGSDASTPPPLPACDVFDGVPQESCGAGLPACGAGKVCVFGCCIFQPY